MKKNRVYAIIMTLILLFNMVNVVNPTKCLAASTYSWSFVDGNGSNGLNADSMQNAQNSSLATFNNELYATWTETNGGKNKYGAPTSVIRVKKYDGTSWSFIDNGTISFDTSEQSDTPKLIEYKGNLYAIWSETSSMWQVRVKKYDGKSWTSVDGGTGINKDKYRNGKSPYVIVYKDELYAMWYETSGGGKLQISKYDGSSWKDVTGVDASKGLNYDSDKTAQNPTAAICNDKLYISWQEGNTAYVPQIRVKSFDGTSWKLEDGNGTNGLNIDSTKYAQSPQLITYNNELYAIWQENQIRVKKFDGTTWTLKDGDDTSGLGIGFVPRAVVYDNQLYVISYGNGKMKVSTYDGTTWAYAGGGQTTGINKDPNQSAFYGTFAVLNNKLYAAWYENNSSSKAQVRVAAMTVTKEIPKSTACDITTWTAPASLAVSGTTATKTVPNGTESLVVDVAVSANATWKLYSDAVCSTEITNKTMNLNVGANTAYIKVTAEDGTTTKTYTVTITRQAPAKSTACDITTWTAPANLAVSGTTATKTVPNGTESLVVDVAVSANATWKLYSDAVCSTEITNKTMLLNVGANTAYIKVTAEDGTTTKTYTLAITRQAPAASSACDITTWTAPASLTLNGATATTTVPNGVTSLAVDVTVSAYATWKLYSDAVCSTEITNKTMNLNVGANTAYIKVTAEDGTTKVYTVTITRQAATPAPTPEPTPAPEPKTVTGSVVDDGSGNKVSEISATVTIDSNGNATVSMNAAQTVTMKQPDGKVSAIKDISKITVASADGSSISVSEDGQIQVKGLAKGTDNKYKITYDLGNGNKVTIGTIEIKISSDGKVSLTSFLIDPYGIITDAATGQAIQGANVTLYYADTQRNRANGKKPNTVVSLPGIDGFKPNNNKNPQISDVNGAYGFMVFPNADYYVVAVKDGYDKYVSETISVNEEIVRHDIKMNKTKAASEVTSQNTNSSTTTDKKLVQTGSMVDENVLVSLGLAFIVLGTIIRFRRN